MQNTDFDRLPNFFIIGAPKAGTSSLYSYLRQHPQIYLPEVKEPHFFDSDAAYGRGIGYYAREFFEGSAGYALRGEASPSYMKEHELVIPRLKALYGDRPLKFLVCLRDPVERAFSHYSHAYASAREHESFERALDLEDSRRISMPHAWVHYVQEGCYDEQLKRWFAAYPRSWFHFTISEKLSRDAASEVGAVLRFLGVRDDYPIDTSRRANSVKTFRSQAVADLYKPGNPLRVSLALLPSPVKRWLRIRMRASNMKPAEERPVMKPETRERLRKTFAPHKQALAELLNFDLSIWQ